MAFIIDIRRENMLLHLMYKPRPNCRAGGRRLLEETEPFVP